MSASGQRKTVFTEEYGNDSAGITIHTTTDLHERNERNSEKTIVQYIRQALDAAERNYEIDFNFPLKEPEIEDIASDGTPGKQNLYEWWRGHVNNEPEFDPRKDSNILLSDRAGGGLGAVGGRVAIAPARHISDYERHRWSDRGRNHQFKNIFGTLRELSHNLGFSHSPHGGNAWNENRKWHRTITVSANDEENLCGQWIPKRRHEREMRYVFFHDCAVKHMDIGDDELIERAEETGLSDPPHKPPDLPEPDTEPPDEPEGRGTDGEPSVEDFVDKIFG